MAETSQLGLPLLAAAQAQKHVTVNEALTRIDALLRLGVRSAGLAIPPGGAEDGAAYVVAPGATGDWLGQEGKIALRVNGGWDFVAPRRGWTVQDEGLGATWQFDGVEWLSGAILTAPGGAATLHRIVEIEHLIGAGASSLTIGTIPAGSLVFGVTARVTAAVTGTATAWSLGVAGSANRYGSGLGKARNAFANGLTGSPVTYYADTPLLLTAEGGNFSGGAVRLAVHLFQLRPPRSA